MKKLLIIFLICICALTPYQKTFAARGYTNSSCYIYSKPSTKAKKIKLKLNTKIHYSLYNKTFYKIKISNKKYAYIQKKYISSTQTNKITWSRGNKMWEKGTSALLTDINTGLSLVVKRVGGLNHFDVEPEDADDAATLLKICGGNYSWACHAGILEVDGKQIPCSFNSMPHGTYEIEDNNYDGRFCIHLYKSKTHETNKENKEHQKCVDKAFKYLTSH